MVADFGDVEVPMSDDYDLDRFSFLDDGEWASLVEPTLAPGTRRKLRFVECLFNEWRTHRNLVKGSDGTCVPHIEVVDFSIEELNLWIPMFVCVVRKKNGDFYRAQSIFEYILALQRLISVKRGVQYRFLKDPAFVPLRISVDNVMKTLQARGLGNDPRKLDIVSALVEEELWRSGILGDESPRLMLRTLVFLLGLNLGLRTGEHRQLRRDMFDVDVHHQYFIYTEWISKCHNGGISDVRKKAKKVKMFSSSCHSRCPVRFLELYLDKT